MTNTDEVIWAAGADTTSSAVYDTYSTTTGRPTEDSTNSYTTTMVANGNYIDFTSTRPLSSSDSNTFTITLDTAIDMIWAWNSYDSSSGFTGVAYHNENKSVPGWTMTVNSVGTVSSSGNIAPVVAPT